MKTTDLFKSNRASKRLNESFERVFGKRIELENFDLHQLQDARNKLRTQISQVRSQSGFNENIENDALTKAQWMLDAINSEISNREEFIVDDVQEGFNSEAEMILHKMAQNGDFDEIYDAMGWYKDPRHSQAEQEVGDILQDMANEISRETGLHPDDDIERIIDRIADRLADEYGDGDFDYPAEPDDSMDGDHDSAMASAGFGSDEDYGYYGDDNNESQQNEFFYFDAPNKKDRGPRDKGHDELERRAKSKPDLGGKDARDYKDAMKKGQYKIGGPKGKLPEDQEVDEKAPPGGKYERMVKHIKKGYAKDGKLSDKERSIAYATAWKAKNKASESIQGDDMKKLTEGEIQQAQSIVTAKTMVDRVGRWIEELSGMENDTLLQLGDQIRDEMGSEQAKNFISAVAPAIQQALENLKTTRETLATGVRTLTGEEQAAGMLGGEPEGDDIGGAAPDMMNPPEEAPLGGEDEFAAAEPAAGGLEDAGREQRESINYQNKLLKVLAG